MLASPTSSLTLLLPLFFLSLPFLSLCAHLTLCAIRYALPSGRAVVSLDDVVTGNDYVVAPNEKFKAIDYNSIEDVNTKRRNYKPPDLSKIGNRK